MLNNENNDRLREAARRVLQPRTSRRLSEEDLRQVAENLTGFFALLRKWGEAERLSTPDVHGD